LADRLTACRSLLLNLSAVAVTDADVPAQIELVVRELTTLPGEILYDELEAPRANGHDRKVTAKRTAPVRQKKAAKVAPTQRWQTLGEQMARYNELVEVAIGLGLTRFCRRGLNGTTCATRAAGDAATAKITTAIAAARRAP